MKEALVMAHVSPKEIQYVNAHGTGTPNNDQSESVSLQRLFGAHMPLVSSTKSSQTTLQVRLEVLRPSSVSWQYNTISYLQSWLGASDGERDYANTWR